MREICLTRGISTLVDDQDFDWLNQWKWHTKVGKNSFYATRTIADGGRRITIWMHRLITGVTDKNTFCDHIDGNGLNNQRSNLRICNRQENNRNAKARIGKSAFKGVDIHNGKYRVRIKDGCRSIHIGYYSDERLAAIAYNEAATKLHGEFARLNTV